MEIQENNRIKIEEKTSLSRGKEPHLCFKGSDNPFGKWISYSVPKYFLEEGKTYRSLVSMDIDYDIDVEHKSKKRFEDMISICKGDIVAVNRVRFRVYANASGKWPSGYVLYDVTVTRALNTVDGVLSSYQWNSKSEARGYGFSSYGYEHKKIKQYPASKMFKLIR